jgi:cytochrome c biogenesis protein CcmG/thiol:disulfide interchange protein DsbE
MSMRSNIYLILPVLIFGVLAVFLYKGLWLNPEELPSPLIGQQAPQFDLPPPRGADAGFKTADLHKGKVSLVNAFASWCVPCHAEHPLLMELQRETDIPIYGINVKDKPEDAEAFLTRNGNPYNGVGADLDGRVSIDWGVYKYPESYIVDGDGKVLYRIIGQITRKTIQDIILPMAEKYNGQAAQS